MLSIIIPTLNEEKYLPLLLKDLEMQTFKDFEVIVADAESKDRTSELAKKFGAKIVKGGKPGIARNRGARVARGEWLLFLDADARVPKKYLASILAEFKQRKLDVAASQLTPDSRDVRDKALYLAWNRAMVVMEKIWPFGGGSGILVKTSVHRAIKGFDTTIHLGEDSNYLLRAAKRFRFGVLRSLKLKNSIRRFQENGRAKVIFQLVASGLLKTLGREDRTNKFRYDFGHGKSKKLPK